MSVTEESGLTLETFVDVLQRLGRAVVTTSDVSAMLDRERQEIEADLERLRDTGTIARREVGTDAVWYPAAWDDQLDREYVITFPEERMIVVDHPRQYTRAVLSQFAHLEARTGSGGYRYTIRPVDIWHAPFAGLDALQRAIRGVIGGSHDGLHDWVAEQWRRAHLFRLETHPDGYTILRAGTPELMGNVARQVLDESHLHAPISETESWVVEGSEAAIKRALYEAGFPVQDERELETGDPLIFETEVTLRDYQRRWVDTFLERQSGVIVGPPGSGKTLAAVAIMERIGGETLVLVPSRELARQWRQVILERTTLGQEEVGEYHGGTKDLRSVTVATYQIAAMSRHRHLFDSRRWGLLVMDEAQHVPAEVFSRAVDLQSRHRLGLTSSPVREDEKQREIFTIIGPPIGTDWSALIEAGYVLEPHLEVRYVPWETATDRESYELADGYERRQRAAMNAAKLGEIERLLERHADDRVLVFVDWLEQGETYAAALDVPFISGETRHAERARWFDDFQRGAIDTLVVSRVGDEGLDLPDASVAILASGLGGSRRQGTQRVGRTMRPTASATVYLLATRGTIEEQFATQQLRYLERKGMEITETNVDIETVEG